MNALVTGELKLPKMDREAGVYRPGWLGTVLVGGAAAAASWGLYGPLAERALVGAVMGDAPVLRVAEFFGAFLEARGFSEATVARVAPTVEDTFIARMGRAEPAAP